MGEAALFAANPRNQGPRYLEPRRGERIHGPSRKILPPRRGLRVLGVLNRGLRGDAQHRRSIPG